MAEPREKLAAAPSTVASCTATDCTYNRDRECHAGSIDVRLEQQGAVCATYEPEAPRARP